MTRSEFLETKEITQFCKDCLDNEFQPEYLTIKELWEKASDINEFKKFVKENKEVMDFIKLFEKLMKIKLIE